MTVTRLSEGAVDSFKSYCRRHRGETDTSFIDEEELSRFVFGPGNPTFLSIDGGRITGASSLMLNLRAGETGRARFRILHSEEGTPEAYATLVEPLRRARGDLRAAYLFVPFKNTSALEALITMGFEKEKAVYQMLRDNGVKPSSALPEGLSLRPFEIGRDEAAWCEIRNSAFSSLSGSKTDVTPEMVREMATGPDRIEGGMMIAVFCGEPVGVICSAYEDYEGQRAVKIGPIAVLPPLQGRGIGRAMLRTAIRLAGDLGVGKVVLNVNTDNENALSLYTDEGFFTTEGFVCLSLRLSHEKGTMSPS